MSLEGKVVLVTGASRGIGLAILLKLGQQGATVIGTATTQEGADKITQLLKAEGIQGEGYPLNVCEPDAIKETLRKIKEAYAAPLILVNNAAITQDNLLIVMKPQQWQDVINTNLNSVYSVTKLAMKPMLKARWGRVITITSVVGVAGNPGQANYCASKAGVIGFTKSVAQEMGAVGITLNTVAPGFIDTDMTRSMTDEQREAIDAQIPMRKIGQPEDIAAAVAFLASDEASYITGQTLHVNGGMCMV